MRVLHVTHHAGCDLDFKFVAAKLNLELETQWADWTYNVTANVAAGLWNKHKDYYESFDAVVTSDTAPLSRIFLQGGFSKRLVIWVCNRFDYVDEATNLDSDRFPDGAYYGLFRDAIEKPNVRVRSYTPFEDEYARTHRGTSWSGLIKPCSVVAAKDTPEAFPDGSLKRDTFLVTRYHNDNIFMDLKAKCDALGISTYRGEYNGPADLAGVKGIIHIPYAWSNLAIFENWSLGNVYLIPTERFLLELSHQPNFFWSPPFDRDLIRLSEWYLPEHDGLFVKFDSWEELREVSEDEALLSSKRCAAMDFSVRHSAEMLNEWRDVLSL